MANRPKYQQVEALLKEKILSGQLKPGDQIMTEEQLCGSFGFSRMTISKALNHLSDLGYIKRTPGKGSFVMPPSVRKETGSSRSFSEDMKSVGMTAGAKLVSYRVVQAGEVPIAMEKLGLQETDLVHFFIRLRTGNDTPIAINYTYIAAKVLPAINVECLSHSFYAYLDTQGIDHSQSARRELRATLPTPEQKRLLGIEEGALLCSSHVTYTTRGGRQALFEYTETYYNGDMYVYTMEN